MTSGVGMVDRWGDGCPEAGAAPLNSPRPSPPSPGPASSELGRHSWQISTLTNNISLDSGKGMWKTKCDKAMESYDGGGVIIFDGVVREGR